MYVRFDTRQPLQEGEELHPFLHQVLDSVWGPETPKPTVAEWYYGEDTLWATGWLLWSQMIRYRVTGDPEALRIARKHGLDDRAHETSRKILLRVNRDGLRECWDNGRLPPEMQPFANLFGAAFPAEWLIAYWMGREQGVW